MIEKVHFRNTPISSRLYAGGDFLAEGRRERERDEPRRGEEGILLAHGAGPIFSLPVTGPSPGPSPCLVSRFKISKRQLLASTHALAHLSPLPDATPLLHGGHEINAGNPGLNDY